MKERGKEDQERRNAINDDAIDVGDNQKEDKLQKKGRKGQVHQDDSLVMRIQNQNVGFGD